MRVASGDEGVSLIEVLVATIILGLAMAAILGGFSVSVRGGVLYGKQAKAETVLRSAAENIVAQGYKKCSGGTLPTYTVTPNVDGLTVAVTAFAYWTGTNPAAFSSSCAQDVNGIGRVSVNVTSPGSPVVVESVDVFVGTAS